MKMNLLRAGVGLALAAALSVAACGDDESSGTVAPQDPPGLSLVAVEGVGGPRWEPGLDSCIELGTDTDQTVLVTIAVSSFVLRPPGTCGSARQCGTALLRVDPSGDGEALRVQAAQTSLAAKLTTLGAGSHTFRVELRDRNDEPVIDKETGSSLLSEITLDVKTPGGCSGVTDAGSDAEAGPSDAASDADASPADAGDAGDPDASDAGPESGDASGSDAGGDAASDGATSG